MYSHVILSLILFFIVESRCQCNNTNPCRLIRGGEELKFPQVLQPTNGRLELTMAVEMTNLTYDWLRIWRRTYNGSIPGPTIQVNPGDTIILTLINNLEETVGDVPLPNTLHFPNHTNLHTHGLHISSKEPHDNVFVDIEPGGRYTYEYNIEEDNPAGTFFYHSHLHGASMFQIHSGLTGLLIVNDPTTGQYSPPKHLSDISCPENCEHDVPLHIQPILQYADDNPAASLRRAFAQLQQDINDDPTFRNLENIPGGGTLEDWLTDPNNGVGYFVTNGQLFPIYTMPTGQRKRFRLVNAGGNHVLELLITDVNGRTPTDACEVWEIAIDGLYRDVARKPRLGKSFVVPGGRVDWIVACSTPGTYELRSVADPLDICSLGSILRHDGLLLTIEVNGTSTAPLSEQETVLPRRPSYVGDFRFLPESQVTGNFVLESSTEQFFNREHFSTDTYYRFKARLGTVQQWFIVNSDPIVGHPIHIHINHFQVISYNEYNGPVSTAAETDTGERKVVYYSQEGDICTQQSSTFVQGDTGVFEGFRTDEDRPDGLCELDSWDWVNHTQRSQVGGPGTLGYAQPGDFYDVLLSPPLSNITVRFLADKFADEVVMHCHILYHEDRGMLMVVKIVEEDEDLTTNVLSGGAQPGSCFGGNAIQNQVDFVAIFVTAFISCIQIFASMQDF